MPVDENGGTTAQETASREVALIKSRIAQQEGRQRTLLERQAAFARDRIARQDTMPPSMRQRVAENLHRVIEAALAQAKDHGHKVTKAMIADAAGMGDGNGKSSRLYDYTLDPDLPDDERRQRAEKRLVKDPKGYLKLAEAAADLGGIDGNRAMVDLVQGTRLAEGIEALPAEVVPDYLTLLADAIQGEARRIAASTGLDWYFRTVDAHHLTRLAEGWRSDYDGWDWPRYNVPWVDLTTESLGSVAGTWWGCDSRGAWAKTGTPKRVQVCRRIGLGLAPLGEGRSVRAFFVRRPGLILHRVEEFQGLDFNHQIFLEGMTDPDGWWRSRNGALHIDAVDVLRSLGCPLGGPHADRYDFIDVTPSSIASVLETGLPVEAEVAGDLLHLPAPDFTFSPPGGAAARLERALRVGQYLGGADSRLMVQLEDGARSHVQNLRAWVTVRLAEIEDTLSTMARAPAGAPATDLPELP